MSGGRESGSLISKTVVYTPNFVLKSDITFSDFHSLTKIKTSQTTKWSNENPKQEQVVVACVEFPDLLGSSGCSQKIGQHKQSGAQRAGRRGRHLKSLGINSNCSADVHNFSDG